MSAEPTPGAPDSSEDEKRVDCIGKSPSPKQNIKVLKIVTQIKTPLQGLQCGRFMMEKMVVTLMLKPQRKHS